MEQNLKVLLKEIENEMKEKNLMNAKKIEVLENEKKGLKSMISQLQTLLIGRKLLKILIKVIIKNCFEDYYGYKEKIYVTVYKAQEYRTFTDVVNNLIKIILENNSIIHINYKIHKLIDIINENSTYEDILKVVGKSMKPNDVVKIKQLFKKIIKQYCMWKRNNWT